MLNSKLFFLCLCYNFIKNVSRIDNRDFAEVKMKFNLNDFEKIIICENTVCDTAVETVEYDW